MFDTSKALCKEIGGEIFFPEKHESYLVYYAKAICRRCPVLDECKEYALSNPDLVGVWGGTTTMERNRARWKIGRDRLESREAS